MPKTNPKKAVADAKKVAQAAKDKLKSNVVTKTAGDIFAKIQAKTGIDNKKIDEWQKKWLNMPEKRTKYQHLRDAPMVVSEELFAMSNDIIDFIQREEGGKSQVFKKMKAEGADFVKHPVSFLRQKYQKGKELAKTGIEKAKEASAKTKEMAGKAKKMADKVKSEAGKKIKK